MNTIHYYKPGTMKECYDLMKESPYILWAGGTDLMVKIKQRSIEPSRVIDLSGLQELHGVSVTDGRFSIGALTTHRQVTNDLGIQEYMSSLAKAASLIGSPQIRNRGTIGGNIGNASPAADTVTAMVALDARVNCGSEQGIRSIPLQEFILAPGKTDLRTGEVILNVELEGHKNNQGASFIKLGKRNSLAIAIVNVSTYLDIDPEKQCVRWARIAIGSVAPTIIRLPEVERVLEGQLITTEILSKIEKTVQEIIKPIDDIRSTAEYRREVAGVIVRNSVQEAFANAQITSH